MVRRGIIASLSTSLSIGVLGVLGLAGCSVTTLASGQTPLPGAPVDVSTTGPQPRSVAGAPGADRPTADPTGPTFPLTLRRTGGIADFHDTVVLNANGTLSVDTNEVHGRTCTLDRSTRNSLLVALSTLRLGGTGATPAPVPEESDQSNSPITVTVTDVHHRPVDLDDPSLGEIRSKVTALIGDVTLTVPATTRCMNATT